MAWGMIRAQRVKIINKGEVKVPSVGIGFLRLTSKKAKARSRAKNERDSWRLVTVRAWA